MGCCCSKAQEGYQPIPGDAVPSYDDQLRSSPESQADSASPIARGRGSSYGSVPASRPSEEGGGTGVQFSREGAHTPSLESSDTERKRAPSSEPEDTKTTLVQSAKEADVGAVREMEQDRRNLDLGPPSGSVLSSDPSEITSGPAAKNRGVIGAEENGRPSRDGPDKNTSAAGVIATGDVTVNVQESSKDEDSANVASPRKQGDISGGDVQDNSTGDGNSTENDVIKHDVTEAEVKDTAAAADPLSDQPIQREGAGEQSAQEPPAGETHSSLFEIVGDAQSQTESTASKNQQPEGQPASSAEGQSQQSLETGSPSFVVLAHEPAGAADISADSALSSAGSPGSEPEVKDTAAAADSSSDQRIREGAGEQSAQEPPAGETHSSLFEIVGDAQSQTESTASKNQQPEGQPASSAEGQSQQSLETGSPSFVVLAPEPAGAADVSADSALSSAGSPGSGEPAADKVEVEIKVEKEAESKVTDESAAEKPTADDSAEH